MERRSSSRNSEGKLFPKEKEILRAILGLCVPERIVLFGSRAKRTHTERSDIDLFVECKNLTFREKRKIREAVDRATGIYSVDIIFSDEANKEFKETVEREGVVVWKKQR